MIDVVQIQMILAHLYGDLEYLLKQESELPEPRLKVIETINQVKVRLARVNSLLLD